MARRTPATDKKPVRTINIHDHLRAKLCDLYENDCIFDKFECSFSGDGQYVSVCLHPSDRRGRRPTAH